MGDEEIEMTVPAPTIPSLSELRTRAISKVRQVRTRIGQTFPALAPKVPIMVSRRPLQGVPAVARARNRMQSARRRASMRGATSPGALPSVIAGAAGLEQRFIPMGPAPGQPPIANLKTADSKIML